MKTYSAYSVWGTVLSSLQILNNLFFTTLWYSIITFFQDEKTKEVQRD